MPDTPLRTVVVGVGNPTLTDDGVGIHAALALAERLAGASLVADGPGDAAAGGGVGGGLGVGGDVADGGVAGEVDVTACCAGGLRLMEAMAGYDRAIVIDALVTGDLPPGTAVELTPGDLMSTHNLTSVHDMSLPYALELGRVAEVPLPDEVRVFGIRAADVTTYGEVLSPEVAAAVPILVDRLVSLLRSDRGAVAERTRR